MTTMVPPKSYTVKLTIPAVVYSRFARLVKKEKKDPRQKILELIEEFTRKAEGK
jgi:hypothetical protein